MWTKDLFGVEKPIIAMCHLQPLPGDPYYDHVGGMDKVVECARKDLHALQDGGVDGTGCLKIENTKQVAASFYQMAGLEQGKTYSMDEIACDFLFVNIFKGAKDSLNKEVDMTVKFEEESKMTVAGGLVLGAYTKTGSFWGCFQVWSLILLIVVIVVVIALIAVAIIMLSKKGKKDLPKKK